MSKKLLMKVMALSMSAAMVMQPVSAFAAEESGDELLLEEEEVDEVEEAEDEEFAIDLEDEFAEEDVDLILEEDKDLPLKDDMELFAEFDEEDNADLMEKIPEAKGLTMQADGAAELKGADAKSATIDSINATSDIAQLMKDKVHQAPEFNDDFGQVDFTCVDWERRAGGGWVSIGIGTGETLVSATYRCTVIMSLKDDIKDSTAFANDVRLTVNGKDWTFVEVTDSSSTGISAVKFLSPVFDLYTRVIIKPGETELPGPDGWICGKWFERYGATYYITAGGRYLHGLHKVEGIFYFFNNSGAIKKNTFVTTHDNTRYYFDKNGWMYKGLLIKNGATYYMHEVTGAMQFRWQSNVPGLNGTYYFRKKTGAMVKDQFLKIDGQVYYFEPKGKAHAGWLTKWDNTYYFDRDTFEMKFGKQDIDGATYYFRPGTGAMVKDSFEIINGGDKYLKPNGKMAKDEQIVKWGVRYFFDGNGNIIKKESIYK